MPQTIINRSLLQDYAKRLTSALFQTFPKDKEYISGDEIKSFTPVKQINLCMLKLIFLDWNNEINKYRSRWFNYEHPEVKSALNNLMNVLSHNICISRTGFMEIVHKSVDETLELIFFPADYFPGLTNQEQFTPEEFEKQSRFICIHKNLLNSLREKLKGKFQNKQTFSTVEAKVFLESLLEKDYPDQISLAKEYLEPIQNICPLDLALFSVSQKETMKTTNRIHQISAEDTGIVSKETQSLHDKFKSERITLNETLKNANEGKTLIDKMRVTKIQDLNTVISISQKFIFIKEIFGGKSDGYDITIRKLNNCTDFTSAKQLLIDECFAGADANEKMEEKAVKEMIGLLERRFPENLTSE